MKFCAHYGLRDIDSSVDTLCTYISFLTQRFTSPQSVANYISGVRLLHKLLGVESQALASFDVSLMLRAAKLNMRHTPRRKMPVTPVLLHQLCLLSEGLGTIGVLLKVAMTFAYYGMLRQSNLAPRTSSAFDPTRHTTRQDIRLAPPGVQINLKWSKTLQVASQGDTVPLPSISGHPTDPVAAYEGLLAALPTLHPAEPLLTLPTKRGRRIAVTSAKLHQCLSILLECLGINPRPYSFHSFRRGGATAAFNAGVTVLDLQRHGTWKSGAFSDYVTKPCPSKSRVAAAFARSTT